MRRIAHKVVTFGCAAAVASCSISTSPPSMPDSRGVQGVEKPDEPFVVDWEPTALADLEVAIQRGGIAVVAYDGGQVRALERCRLSGRYEREEIPPVSGHLRMKSAQSAQAALTPPGFTAQPGVAVQRGTFVDFTYAVRSKRSADRRTARTSELSGECAGATHFVQAIHLGAFERERRAAAAATGEVKLLVVEGRAQTDSARAVQTNGGDLATCRAPGGWTGPPEGCNTPVRLKLNPLTPSVYERLELDSYEVVAATDPQGNPWDRDGTPPDPIFILGNTRVGPYPDSMQHHVGQPLTDLVEVPEQGWKLLAVDDDLLLEPMGEVNLAPDELGAGSVERVLTQDGRPVVKVRLHAEVRRDVLPVRGELVVRR